MQLNFLSGQIPIASRFGQAVPDKISRASALPSSQDTVQIRFGQRGRHEKPSVETRLMDAIRENDLLEVQSTLYDGADINATDKSGAPVITQAIRRHELIPGASIDLISFLLQDKIVIDGPNGPVEVDKANPNQADKAGFTPLMHVLMADFADPAERETVVNLLLAAGADPTMCVPSVMGDDKGISIPALAREQGLPQLADRLEVEMIGFNAQAELGGLAESFGAGGKKLLVSDPILFPGLDFNETADAQGRTLLMRLIIHDYFNEALFDFLTGEQLIHAGNSDLSVEDQAFKRMEARTFINEQDEAGNTALMYAALEGRRDIADKLLKAQADPTLENRDGKTAADLAEVRGFYPLAATLREKEMEARINKAFQ